MNDGEGGVNCAVVGTGAKLVRREDRVQARIVQNTGGDDLLQEFAAALKEGDRPVCRSNSVIRFIWLRDGNHLSSVPRVGAVGDASVEQVNEAGGASLKGPFKQLVADTRYSWCRGVRGGG